MKKTVLALAVAAVAGFAASANAAPISTGGVFTMRSGGGFDTSAGIGGGLVNVDPSIAGFVDQTAGTWGVASTTPFFGNVWTASNGQLVSAPGTYNLNTATDALTSVGSCTVANDGNICFNVGAGQIAGTIDFAWSVSSGIRVVNVWNINGNGSLTAAAVPGMENGPFPGFNAAFDLTAPNLVTAVPVPAAVWLFGSGLLGLVGIARRKKAA